MNPTALAEDYRPYAWSPSNAEVAARHGLRPEQVLRFDQNTPPVPGVPQVPLAESFARLNEYPDGTYRELREAAAAYAGVEPGQIVAGAGADELIAVCAKTFLAPGRRAAVTAPTYGMYRIASQLEGADVVTEVDGADLIWVCNPNNPTGELRTPDEVAELAGAHPDAAVVVDEAYWEFAGATCVPLLPELPNLIVVRTLSKAFGLAALRVGYAVASPEVAAELDRRRPPGSISAPAARIAAAALREPRLDVEATVAERERVRAALVAAGHDCPAAYGNFVWLRSDEPLGERLEEAGLVVRIFAEGIRISLRRPHEDDVLLAVLGATAGAAPGRTAFVTRTSTETALRLVLDLDGAGRARVATGIGFLDHLLTLWAFHGNFDLEVLAGGDLDVDEHHTVEDVLAALGDALAAALGDRTGVARYGSASVPMDEALATAAVDLVRRPHVEIELAFAGDRIGGLAPSLLPHALERLAMQGGFTLHLSSSGKDDHHVAEAAFKALGQALRQACSPRGEGVRSTKGFA
ncbi:MAG: aminotransferase class I/II-fold pyridoxal phosphate-dependent enzyme [Actinobacteria bacterium]|nr:aminotransferase class I/II-fold pyridoxal phosphate-dependent enzyme [Actinomycetota bacterium]